MGNPFNPYNLETFNYSSTCNGITGETVSGIMFLLQRVIH